MDAVLAEDNDINRTFISAMLERYGYQSITSVCDGLEAVEAAKKEKFDISTPKVIAC